MRRPKGRRYERYELEASLWAQNPTQRDLATLIGMKKAHLEAIVRDKERYVRRRTIEINGKVRNLAVPIGRLRSIHERIKFHLNKVKQPPYLCSPRKGVGQRDNAQMHTCGVQILKIDIRQFYPKTTQEDIWRWAHYSLGIMEDVAGLLAKLIAIDGRIPFGSPVSPVIVALIHRPMFDKVASICASYGLTMSLWVDDITISGLEVPGDAIDRIRDAIRSGGFDTHKVEKLTASRPICITGVPISKGRVFAPRAVHQRIQNGYADLRNAVNDAERSGIIDELLSALGTYRYHMGVSTKEGRRAADQMHALKQRRAKMTIVVVTPQKRLIASPQLCTSDDTALWD